MHMIYILSDRSISDLGPADVSRVTVNTFSASTKNKSLAISSGKTVERRIQSRYTMYNILVVFD